MSGKMLRHGDFLTRLYTLTIHKSTRYGYLLRVYQDLFHYSVEIWSKAGWGFISRNNCLSACTRNVYLLCSTYTTCVWVIRILYWILYRYLLTTVHVTVNVNFWIILTLSVKYWLFVNNCIILILSSQRSLASG